MAVSTTPPGLLDPKLINAVGNIEAQLNQVLLGKQPQVRMAVAALISGEHLLFEDVPGVGKTTLARAMAAVIGGEAGRVQGTPDLMPADLTGQAIYNQAQGRRAFRPGPMMANVVLIDELNRVTPRTQSALLEAMAEGSVTVDGVSHPVPRPFLVIATMNPGGDPGSFPLTPAQRDRFGASVGLGPLDRATERAVVSGSGGPASIASIEPEFSPAILDDLRSLVASVHMADRLIDYMLDVCDRLRFYSHVSVRAPKSWMAMAKGLALLDGRDYVVPDNLRAIATSCLTHRIAEEDDVGAASRVRSVVEEIPLPTTNS